MKIELWSDYACPYCYIGEARLWKVLAELEDSDRIEVEYKSFELDPTASREVVSDTATRFAHKYGLSLEGAKAKIEQISQMGRAEGLEFNYLDTRYTNTFDSLRLAKYAFEQGHPEMNRVLFDAYFTRNLELADHEVLVQLAVENGMDEEETRAFLKSDKYAKEVRADEDEAMRLGVHGVPYFLINGQYAAPGAVPAEMLKGALEKLLAEEKAAEAPEELFAGAACGPDGCHF